MPSGHVTQFVSAGKTEALIVVSDPMYARFGFLEKEESMKAAEAGGVVWEYSDKAPAKFAMITGVCGMLLMEDPMAMLGYGSEYWTFEVQDPPSPKKFGQ